MNVASVDATSGVLFTAPAKLNLFLHVVGRRDDGYHLIQSAFQLIDLADTLTITRRDDGDIVRLDPLPGVAPEADLAVRAARRLQAATGTRWGADITIAKRIPIGGGLGGGSSDAATTLLALNGIWKLGLSRTELIEIGAALGADLPFFLYGRNAFVEGIGEILTPLTLPARDFALIYPGVAVSTAAVFTAPELTRNTAAIKILDFSKHAESLNFPVLRDAKPAVDGLPAGVGNDLQTVVASRYPKVRDALAWLAQEARDDRVAAIGPARMSGSGACVFRAFASRADASRRLAALPAGWTGWCVRSLAVHPHRELAQD